MQQRLVLTLLCVALALPAFAAGEKPLTLTDRVEREIVVVENGTPVTRIVPAQAAEPGAELIYTLRYANTATAPVANPKFVQKVPELATYIAGSAFGAGATQAFSVDGGQSFGPLDALQVVDAQSGKPRPATATDVTHIRWQLAEIPAGTAGELGYRYRIK